MSEILAAVALFNDLAQTAVRIAGNLQVVSSIVLKAQAEGRDKLTPDEWAALDAIDDKARDAIIAAARV